MAENIAFGIVIGLIFISLVVLFCVIIVKLYIHKVKTYTKVIYEKDLNFQKTVNTAILETQEQVLNNISQDLHDDAGQQLTYINFQLENLKLDSPDLNAMLTPISDSVAQLSNTIRRISHSLNNELMSQQDLVKAIISETERLQQNPHLTIFLNIDDAVPKIFGANEKIVIYRIFQESINNILKHSQATTITITIVNGPSFKMLISDNGKGFDFENASAGKLTVGLQGMRARASIINYTLDVVSSTGNGTSVTLAQNNI